MENLYTKDQFLNYILEYMKYILHYGTNQIYKFKTTNSHILIEELIHYLQISKDKDIFNNNIVKILEELYIELSNDLISKTNNSYFKDLINPFIKYLDKISKEGKNGLNQEVKKELLIRLNSINNIYQNKYLSFLQKELNSLLLRINNESIDGNKFFIYENLINSYFTEVLYKGLSKRALMNIIYEIEINDLFKEDYLNYFDEYFFGKINKSLLGNNKIITFLKVTLNKQHIDAFTSFLQTKENFELNGNHENVTLDNINSNIEKEKEYEKINKFFDIKDNTILFKYVGQGVDYISQGNFVKKILDNMVDFLKWEFPKGSFKISPLYVSYDVRTSKYYTSYYYLDHDGHRHEGGQEYLDKRLEMFNKISNGNIDEEIEGKLFTMLKYYRLGLNSSTYEERFLNLWIGWEHIFSNNLNDKTGWNNIQKYVPYILTIEQINQNLWLLIKGELSLEEKNLFFSFLKDNRIYKDDLQPSCNLYIILHNDDIFNKLLDKLGNNLIGKGKLLALRNELYIDDNKKIGDVTLKYLEKYHKNITLQLYRMNRIRNSIVHTGKNNFKFLEYVTSDLEKYYLLILEDLLEHFTQRNGFSLDDYFLRTEKTYESLFSYLKSEIFKSNDVKTRGEKLTSFKIIF